MISLQLPLVVEQGKLASFYVYQFWLSKYCALAISDRESYSVLRLP